MYTYIMEVNFVNAKNCHSDYQTVRSIIEKM
jgi:hypothetical protein